MTDVLKVLSLGAGVQSSTLALMAAAGAFERPACAVFADTGWEPAAVYTWLDWLETQLPFPVYRVSAGDLRREQINARMRGTKAQGERFSALPYFTLDDRGNKGMVKRQCTNQYKIKPITRKIRELLGLKPRQHYPARLACEHWYGISLDEIQRCKSDTEAWETHRYPLIELRMTRQDCLRWMTEHNYPRPPRSACLGCPFHSDAEWREIKQRPEEWADVVEFDNAIRRAGGVRGDTFLHAQRVPLDQVDLRTEADYGQLSMLDECAGVCGV